MPPHSKSTHLPIFARFAPPARLRTQGSLLHQVVNSRLVRCFDGGMPRWRRRPEEHCQGHAFCWTQVTQSGGLRDQITDFAINCRHHLADPSRRAMRGQRLPLELDTSSVAFRDTLEGLRRDEGLPSDRLPGRR
jgi:hypothetical protein